MSPLLKGPGSIRNNVTELMRPAQSPARKKGILTLAKRRNVGVKQAQFTQAIAIAKSQARKK